MTNTIPEILFEDNNYLVINKPAGLIVHGGNGISSETLVDFLIKHYPPISQVGDDPVRPGIVHRLDKEASGLMVIAKNQISFDSLKKQFQERSIKKEYTALVYGVLMKDEDIIDFTIKRASRGYKMAAMPRNTKKLLVRKNPRNRDRGNIEGVFKAKEAITEFKVIKKLINYTLIKVITKTGRTHQIRVHLYAYGHPLVGDNLYSTHKTKDKNKKIKLGRIFLIADRLSFSDLNNVKKKFSLSLPIKLQTILESLK